MINSKEDFDNATTQEQGSFKSILASTINNWAWESGEWVLKQSDRDITPYGFALSDFHDAPIPTMPSYNPDEKEKQAQDEARIAELKTLLSESDYKTLPDYDKTDEAILVQRQAWRDEIRTLEVTV